MLEFIALEIVYPLAMLEDSILLGVEVSSFDVYASEDVFIRVRTSIVTTRLIKRLAFNLF